MKAIILAAGIGSRLGKKLPKPLTRLPSGLTIIENQIKLLKENIEQHPLWGAELAAQHGTSPLSVALIARHQEELIPLGESGSSTEDDLLRRLQIIDNNS